MADDNELSDLYVILAGIAMILVSIGLVHLFFLQLNDMEETNWKGLILPVTLIVTFALLIYLKEKRDIDVFDILWGWVKKLFRTN